MVQRRLTNEDGYTVVEILVTLTIVSIVMGIVGSVFVFVSRQMNQWSENTQFYNEYEMVQNQIFRDILRAEVLWVTDSTLIITERGGSLIEYSLTDPVLNRKDVAMVENADSLILSLNGGFQDGDVKVWSVSKVEQERKLEKDFILNSRKPSLWEPLKTQGEN